MTVRNYSVDRSANLSILINVTNANGAVVDLTGYTCNAYYKTHVEAANSVAMGASGLANGLLTVSLTGTQTSAATMGRYMYEVYVTETATGRVSRVQEGLLTFTGGLS